MGGPYLPQDNLMRLWSNSISHPVFLNWPSYVISQSGIIPYPFSDWTGHLFKVIRIISVYTYTHKHNYNKHGKFDWNLLTSYRNKPPKYQIHNFFTFLDKLAGLFDRSLSYVRTEIITSTEIAPNWFDGKYIVLQEKIDLTKNIVLQENISIVYKFLSLKYSWKLYLCRKNDQIHRYINIYSNLGKRHNGSPHKVCPNTSKRTNFRPAGCWGSDQSLHALPT